MKTVMVVDDSTSIRNVLKASLVKDYTVLEAEDGLKGLELSKTSNVDAFLLDVNMPQMDGITMLGELKKIERYKSTLTLMLTTETKDELRTKAKQLGASGWVIKPCDPEKLLEILKQLLS